MSTRQDDEDVDETKDTDRAARRRKFDLECAYPLHKDYPAEFEKVCQLEPLRPSIDAVGKDELQIQLGEIVYLHRRRYSDAAYQDALARGETVPTPWRLGRSSKRNKPADELPYFNRIYETLKELHNALGAVQNAS